ncbi:MAG: type II toxin-antitoxin system RelE/ParE family toxin [Syntrophus sp. (in: bacteria)]|jgi:mRNA interferase RelE/StbE|nr:type II toxin-antitoxin system RelE/ParE family toxin [Syntrophus sp. (in: bacteria)]
MGEYKILFKESVEKDLRSIPKKDLKKILLRIQMLAKDPKPPGHGKLTGQEKYRIRQGTYRTRYSIQDQELTVWVVKVGHRGRGVSEWSISYRASSCTSRAEDVGTPPFRHRILGRMGKCKRTTHLVE